MKKEEYFEFAEKFFADALATSRKKNSDYTGGTVDPFSNFTRVEKLDITSTEVGFLTRMTDKISRINSFVKNGTLQVEDESVTDTLRDLANYSALLAGYIESKRREKADKAPQDKPLVQKTSNHTKPIDSTGL